MPLQTQREFKDIAVLFVYSCQKPPSGGFWFTYKSAKINYKGHSNH